MDPQFNRVTSTLAVASSVIEDTGAAAVGEGSVWAVFGDSTLARIDPADVRVADLFARGRSAAVGGRRRKRRGLGGQRRRTRPSSVSTRPRSRKAPYARSASAAARSASPSARERSGSRTRRTTRSHELIPFTGSARTIGVGRGPTAVAVGAGCGLGREHCRLDDFKGRSRDEQRRRHDRDRKRPERPGCERRSPLGRRAGAVVERLPQAGGGQVERRTKHDAADPVGHERRLVEEADGCRRQRIAREVDVEVAVRPVPLGALQAACSPHAGGVRRGSRTGRYCRRWPCTADRTAS